MELIKAQMATIGTLRESQTKQDEMIMQLRKEVERLTELVCVMKPTNQPPNEPKVIPEVIDFDDSDDDSLLQDELYQEMDETIKNKQMMNHRNTLRTCYKRNHRRKPQPKTPQQFITPHICTRSCSQGTSTNGAGPLLGVLLSKEE